MRIVDVCAFYTPTGGGVRTYIDAKLKAAARLGHELIILAPGARSEVVHRGPGALVATIPGPLLPVDRRYRYFADEAELHRALDLWRPDHVEASSPWASAAMVGRWQGPATRSLVMHCDPLAAYAYRWLGGLMPAKLIDRLFNGFWQHLRRLDSMFDLVVCANAHLTDRLGSGGIAGAETIGMGIETGTFSPSLRSSKLRLQSLRLLGLGESATLLIGVGRFSAEKRWDMVLRAVAEAAHAHPLGLLIIGDGPRRPKLERLAARVGSTVVMPPIRDRDELARLLASADALVHGCEAETFCMVAAEARASGVPLIVPDHGGAASQLVADAGATYRSGSQDSLERAIGQFIDRGPELQRMRAVRNSEVRSADQHFKQLFDRYAELSSCAPTVTLSA